MTTNILDRVLTPEIADTFERSANVLERSRREGQFQRWLALVAGLSSALSGLEVGYMHYRGSYSRRVMYSPVILSISLFGAGLWAFRGGLASKTILRAVSGVTLADCAIGSYFHIRGIQRKPGGWRLPLTNVVMGPPVFAPLLFSISAYLGVIASLLGTEGNFSAMTFSHRARSKHWSGILSLKQDRIDWRQDLSEGRFQRHMSAATAIAAAACGCEAFYSHYKSNFRYKAQWTPVVVAPILATAAASAIKSEGIARTWLPAASSAAMLDGLAGFAYHARGVVRRPGGFKMMAYNVLHGPPIFAPLLFAAAGFIGLLASLMRREKKR
ncbi:MAG: hypothetical protein JOZ29_18010 [Deltaproteobacteria bacterium]|nr:hypothetical protein [Deltaproteobacteria bacterium]